MSVFRWQGAAEDFRSRYSKYRNHKAFAQSRSGAWGFYSNLGSVQAAMQAALDDCRKYNVENEQSEPCRIVNLNGVWAAQLQIKPNLETRTKLSVAELTDNSPDLIWPIHYDYFKPMGTLSDEVHQLEGHLQVPVFTARSRSVRIEDDSFVETTFPELNIGLTVSDKILLPLERDRLLLSEDRRWYVIVSPGKVWRELDDGNWSRGALPVLVYDIDSFAPYYGVATFLFNETSMSAMRFQFSQETANWAQFDIWGQTSAKYTPGPVEGAQQARESYATKLEKAIEVRPWHKLESRFSKSLEEFDGDGNRGNISVSGLMIEDVFYLRACRTRAGPYPFCDQMRHGVFSITKSLGASIAMLWLAKQFGADVYNEKISKYITIPATHEGWENVTFGNALDMTTGVGNRVPEVVDYYVEVDDSPISNQFWNASSTREKFTAIASFDNYPWGPGEVFRYRSTDTFVLSAAMQAFLRKKYGDHADLWDILTREVFVPLGIDRLPVLRTIEVGDQRGTPILASGMFATFEEVIKLAKLLQNHGEYRGRQLLHRELTARTVSTDMNRGFQNGWVNRQGGKGHYEKGFWLSPQNWAGCEVRTTGMAGFGGNYVIIMPNNSIGLRFADGYDDDPATWDSFGIRSVSHTLRPFC